MSYELLVEGDVCTPSGYKAAGITAGIKVSKKPDLGILLSDVPAQCFAVFTTNKVAAAPVHLCKAILSSNQPVRGVIVNSGNANACTGKAGMDNARTMVTMAQQQFQLPPDSLLVCSTGIIGQPLPMDCIQAAIPSLAKELQPTGGHHFSEAILTTDTRTKHIGAKISTSQGDVYIGGCTKGSGMIHPNMATMLAFVTTDIALPADFKAEYLQMIADSFNSITVDGDTSTNDTCLLLANGASGLSYHELSLSEQGAFRKGLFAVLESLAKMIVKDGEGATKMVQIQVKNAKTRTMARVVSRFVANSKLVKTAIFGEDPNWGRLLSSAGSSGQEIDGDAIDIWIGEHMVVQQGCGTGISRELLRKEVCKEEYTITIDLHIGDAQAQAWTSDLSYEYVRINAEYTT
jgi:glutamate N-acetyltransferase / amino-acid N-acetyltransferase